MITIPYKIVLTSPGGRQFIFYKHRRADMLVEVFEFEGEGTLNHHLGQIKEQFAQDGLPFACSTIEFIDKHYLLVAIQIHPNKIEYTQEGADKLKHPLKRLANWYLYTYLIPKSKGEPFVD